MFDGGRDHGIREGLDGRESSRALRSEPDAPVARGISVLDDDDRPYLTQSDHDWLDGVNRREASLAAWEAAPECPDCLRGITAEDDVCQRCFGEGRLL